MQAPKIDKRSYEELVTQTEELVQTLTPWKPTVEMDAGGALIRIFGRFAEIVVNRLNQVPEKSFLSFLNLIGADMAPAQPARVPLTFQLAADSPVDAFVPAGTQVAAPAGEEVEAETIFETEQDVLVTRSRLTAVYTRAFDAKKDQDQYGQYTATATGLENRPFPYFAGNTEIEHFLYIACDALLNIKEPTDITLRFQTNSAAQLNSLPLTWAYWDGEHKKWQPFTPAQVNSQAENGKWVTTLTACPPLKAGVVNEIAGGWLRLQLHLPLPPSKQALPLDGIAVGGGQPTQLTLPLTPFGANSSGQYFYLSGETAFLRRGATATIDIVLETLGKGSNLGLELMIQHTNSAGNSTWQSLPIQDGTAGLTQNGQIRFPIPADGSWQVTSRFNWTGRWCRFAKSGTYSQAPKIKSLTVGTAWNLPTVAAIQVALPSVRPPILTGKGFTNSVLLDLSKDFYPFDEEPQFNDTFYFAYGQVIKEGGIRTGDIVGINVTLTADGVAGGKGASNSATVDLLWEFWNGRQWESLGKSSNKNKIEGETHYSFQDESLAFTTNNKKVQFNLPTNATTNVVNGEEDHWLRVRLVKGNYGKPASYAPPKEIDINGQKVPIYDLVEANFASPIITSMSFDVSARTVFSPSACQSYNDFTFADHKADSAIFTPFTPTSDTLPTLYLGFDKSFDNRSVTLYTQVLQPAPDQVLPQQLINKVYDNPAQLVWEYAQNGGWRTLAVHDETAQFSDRGLIRFIGPKRFSKRKLFGQELYWLRVRWQKGQFLIFPYGQRLRLNTIWAAQTNTISDELLGSSNGNPNQTFQTVRQPIQFGQRLEVREMALSKTELTRLQSQKAVTLMLNEDETIEEIWVTWQETADFYTSAPNDRHYTLDHMSGRIQFGDGSRGLIPPIGQNNVRLARYRSGGGAQGNRAQGSIIQLKTAVPYIDNVINHEAAAGGAAKQSLDSVKRYGPRTLRHRNRAVTKEDVEDLAFAASTKVARALAVPPRFRPLDLWLSPVAAGETAPDLTQHRDVKEAGRMGLIIVPQSIEDRPAPGAELLDRVRSNVLSHMDATASLWISGPDWMEVTVTAVIIPTSLAAANFAGEQVAAALRKFLHPLTGGFSGKGWQFGRRPYRSDLFTFIEGVVGVDYVKALSVSETPAANKLPPEQFLIYSGQHVVTAVLDGM